MENPKCDLCGGFIRNRIMTMRRNGKDIYLHPFCFTYCNQKNPSYKSLHSSQLQKILYS